MCACYIRTVHFAAIVTMKKIPLNLRPAAVSNVAILTLKKHSAVIVVATLIGPNIFVVLTAFATFFLNFACNTIAPRFLSSMSHFYDSNIYFPMKIKSSKLEQFIPFKICNGSWNQAQVNSMHIQNKKNNS